MAYVEPEPFCAGDYIRFVRRGLDMSQREFAAHAGVSQSAIARAELDGADVGILLFTRLMATDDWHLEVATADGEIIVPSEVLRDRSGRRFPSHLDVRPSGRTWWATHWPSRMYDVPEHTFDLARSRRDRKRLTGY